MRWLLVVLCGCGRLGFDATSAGDAKSMDTTSDGAAACKPSYELCDGFEGASFDPVWMVGTNAALDSTVAHRGGQSLHVFSNPLLAGDAGEFSLDEDATLALDDPTFYVRAYLMLPVMPLNHMRAINAGQVSGSPMEDGVYINPGEITVYSQFSESTASTNQPPPLGSWFCVLWTVNRTSTATGSLALAGDPPMIELDDVVTDANPKISRMGFGIEFAAPTETFDQPRVDLWIDDVIIAPSPLTCAD